MRDDATNSGTSLDGPGTNWAGTYSYGATSVERPTSLDAAAEIVARTSRAGGTIRGLGTRHSFSDVADGPGVLLDLTAIPTDLVIEDGATRTVTLGAGTRYGDVAPTLDAAGLAFHNMGSLPHISIAGATATGTHGSGTRLGSLSTAVTGLSFLTPDGSTRSVRRGDPEFELQVVHLGLLGVVTRVTLDVEPASAMRQDAFGPIPWSTFTAHLEEVFAAGTSVCCFTNWDGQVREVLVKSQVHEASGNTGTATGTAPHTGTRTGPPDSLVGAPRLPPVPGDGRRTARDGTVGPWWDRLPHFTIDSTPSVGSEVQSEHFVPLRNGAAALDAVHALASIVQPHLHVAELRTMAADGLPLSPTQGEDVLCIAFTWKKHVAAVAAILPAVEAALAPYGGRPHWGKSTSLGRSDIEALYPALGAFQDLAARVDPARTFRSGFAERMLGT